MNKTDLAPYLIDVDLEECHPRTQNPLRILKITLLVKSELPSFADMPVSSDGQEFWFSFEKNRDVESKIFE